MAGGAATTEGAAWPLKAEERAATAEAAWALPGAAGGANKELRSIGANKALPLGLAVAEAATPAGAAAGSNGGSDATGRGPATNGILPCDAPASRGCGWGGIGGGTLTRLAGADASSAAEDGGVAPTLESRISTSPLLLLLPPSAPAGIACEPKKGTSVGVPSAYSRSTFARRSMQHCGN